MCLTVLSMNGTYNEHVVSVFCSSLKVSLKRVKISEEDEESDD